MIQSTLSEQNKLFWCQGWWKNQAQWFFGWNEAEEVIEASEVVEAVEVVEAAEVSDAREITQYEKCKLSFSLKKHKRAKNIEIKIWKTTLQ